MQIKINIFGGNFCCCYFDFCCLNNYQQHLRLTNYNITLYTIKYVRVVYTYIIFVSRKIMIPFVILTFYSLSVLVLLSFVSISCTNHNSKVFSPKGLNVCVNLQNLLTLLFNRYVSHITVSLFLCLESRTCF